MSVNSRRRHGFVGRPAMRPLVGLITVAVIGAVIAVAVGLFRGSYTTTLPVTVMAHRAGLVMNPDAKVKMAGIQVGRVASIEDVPGGMAAIHLAMDPAQLNAIPDNVVVDIASTTVFGAKFVQLVAPAQPSAQSMHPGQVVDAQHVTVEINTLFQQLTSVLSRVEPDKLNETLGAIAAGLNGRGHSLSRTIGDLDALLASLEPSMPALGDDIAQLPTALSAYADAAPDLMHTADMAGHLSRTIEDQQQNLDALLVGVIGLADIGTDVVATNQQALTDVLRLLVPITDLTNQYNQALYCGVAGILPLANNSPLNKPGVEVLSGFLWGQERYRYPENLPKVAATGGPQCTDMPRVPYGVRPPFVVTDSGANPWKYNNPGIVLNSAGLKELLFGPIEGPPRNSAQIGQPG